MPCRKVGLAGHEQWAAWAAKALGAQLRSSMHLDPALAANIPLRGWADTVVTHVNFHTPKCLRYFDFPLKMQLMPSPCSDMCLAGICWER